MKSSSPTHQEISQHAYQIYVRNGCKHGHELEHWLQAETELSKMMAEPAVKAPQAANGKATAAEPSSTPPKTRAPGKKAPKSAR